MTTTVNIPRCLDCTMCVRKCEETNLAAYCAHGVYDTPQNYRRITGADALKTSPLWCPRRNKTHKA